jgi:hypothetical protein
MPLSLSPISETSTMEPRADRGRLTNQPPSIRLLQDFRSP